jgi:hypothetical protein
MAMKIDIAFEENEPRICTAIGNEASKLIPSFSNSNPKADGLQGNKTFALLLRTVDRLELDLGKSFSINKTHKLTFLWGQLKCFLKRNKKGNLEI